MNEIINNPILWLICSVTVIIVALQAGLFVRLALRNAESFELSRAQCLKAFRIGMVTAFGPSLGILIVMVGLMTVLGEPLTWMRLSMIVSAANELTAAQIGAQAVGIEFNSPDFGTAALFVAWLGMAVNGIGSLVGALAFSGSLENLKESILEKRALVLKDGPVLIGALAFSRSPGSIDFLGIHPQYRNCGIQKLFLNALLLIHLPGQDISTTTYRKGDKADTGYRNMLLKLGFSERELLTEYGYPTQRFVYQSRHGEEEDHASP